MEHPRTIGKHDWWSNYARIINQQNRIPPPFHPPALTLRTGEKLYYNGPFPLQACNTYCATAGVFLGFSIPASAPRDIFAWHVVYGTVGANEQLLLRVYPFNFIGEYAPLPGRKRRSRRSRLIAPRDVFFRHGIDMQRVRLSTIEAVDNTLEVCMWQRELYGRLWCRYTVSIRQDFGLLPTIDYD